MHSVEPTTIGEYKTGEESEEEREKGGDLSLISFYLLLLSLTVRRKERPLPSVFTITFVLAIHSISLFMGLKVNRGLRNNGYSGIPR